MYLTFIGTNGSMGLERGRTYQVHLWQSGRMLCVTIHNGFMREIMCPYETTAAFAKNWATPTRTTLR